MNRDDLFTLIRRRRSFLCVGLDPVIDRLPAHLEGDILTFNKAIIDNTRDLCVAYKPNLAFYEALGASGYPILQQTIDYIGDQHFIIADAKRADVGHTAEQYARAYFDGLGADAITVSPYMGRDSVTPFLAHSGKWTILLGLTSNAGSSDFQLLPVADGQPLYASVMRQAQEWGSPDQLMFVCGATHPEKFQELRTLAPDSFFLVPGVGAQGGDLIGVSRFGMNAQCGLLVNSSRGILYAGKDQDFATAARKAAGKLQKSMAAALATFLP